jgi:hypothetical protein
VFEALTVRGGQGTVVFGYQNAAVLGEWEIRRPKGAQGEWTLTARTVRVNPAFVRRQPLFFTAPRTGGFWCFPIVRLHDMSNTHLFAQLGPPEH